jgi:hypothetical protein
MVGVVFWMVLCGARRWLRTRFVTGTGLDLRWWIMVGVVFWLVLCGAGRWFGAGHGTGAKRGSVVAKWERHYHSVMLIPNNGRGSEVASLVDGGEHCVDLWYQGWVPSLEKFPSDMGVLAGGGTSSSG